MDQQSSLNELVDRAVLGFQIRTLLDELHSSASSLGSGRNCAQVVASHDQKLVEILGNSFW